MNDTIRIEKIPSLIETLSAEACAGKILEQVEALEQLERMAKAINASKRELNHIILQTVIDNEWYDALSLNKRNIRRYL